MMPLETVTDGSRVERKLAWIESSVQSLKDLARLDQMQDDLVQQGFINYTLQTAIQAAIDVAAHIVADQRLGLPSGNPGCFLLLGVKGWLPEDLAGRLSRMARFRNVLIYRSSDVDLDKVEEIVTHHLGDLLAFVAAVRQRLS